MSDNGFNLIYDPWIPIGGKRISMQEALACAHELPGCPDGNPALLTVLIRLLVPIVYRITELDDPALSRREFASRQAELLNQGRFNEDRINEYLTQWSDRFWLVNPPADGQLFAQDPALTKVDPHEIAKAVPVWSAGNNPNLGPYNPEIMPPDTAAIQMLLLRFYAWGGLHTKHPDHPNKGKYVHGVLRDTISLHPLGRTLAETLILNLLPLSAGDKFGVPFWEAPPPSNTVAPHQGRAGMLEQIAGRQDKTMLLRTDGMGTITGFTIAEGPGVSLDLACRDPYLLLDEEAGEPCKPRAGRAFWRETEAILPDKEGTRVLSAKILDWARTPEFGVSAYQGDLSWTAVTHRGLRSKDLEWNRSTCPQLLDLFQKEASRRAKDFLAEANSAEGTMCKQLAKVWNGAKLMPSKAGDKAAVYAVAKVEFWKRCEADFWDTAVNGRDSDAYIPHLRRCALAGYDAATSRLVHERRTHKLVVESRRWINMWNSKSSNAEGTDKENH